MHKHAISAADCTQQVEQLQTVAMLVWLSATLQSIVPARIAAVCEPDSVTAVVLSFRLLAVDKH